MLTFSEKKAKLLSLWWFFVLVIIGTGIIAGVLIFYSQNIDTRAKEAEILTSKIINCLVEQGDINEDFFSEDFDVYSWCGLNKGILTKNGLYFFRIEVFSLKGDLLKDTGVFGANFEEDCNIAERVLKAEKFPRCSKKSIFVKSNEEVIKLVVNSGSNYLGGKI